MGSDWRGLELYTARVRLEIVHTNGAHTVMCVPLPEIIETGSTDGCRLALLRKIRRSCHYATRDRFRKCIRAAT